MDFLEDFYVDWSNSEAVPIPNSLAQAVDALAITTTPTYILVTSQFNWLGLDPRNFIGSYITAYSINEHHATTFSLIDGSHILLQLRISVPK